MFGKKVKAGYFNKDYWMTPGKRSGYSPQEGYTRQDFQWEAIAVMLRDIFGSAISGNSRFPKDGKKYLEAGCAFGWIVEWLDKFEIDAYGFDISRYAVDNAPPRVQAAKRILCSDGFSLPYDNEAFDVLYTLETAEHLHPDDIERWWRELHRVLKPGAKVFCAVCVGHNNKRGVTDPDKSHQTLQPKEWWYDILGILGFARDEKLEDKLYNYKVKTDRLDEPLCLAKYYDWRILGLVRK